LARILYFTRDYTPHDHRFLSALVKAGLEVFYLRLERRGHSLEDRPLPPEVHPVQWAGGRGPARFRDGLHLLSDLKRVIRQIQPDLIQAGPLQTAAFLVALTGFRPLVSMSWGYDLLLDAQRNFLWRWVTRFTLSHSAVMVGDCETIRRQSVAHGMPDERIVTFPWGIDLEQFTSPTVMVERSDKFILLSTRGWEPVYGVEVLAKAFVQSARQRADLRLVMLGNGSQAGLLKSIFRQGGVLDRVEFPGQVKQAELPDYYRSADLYVSASHSDGTSISLLEAMACGLPAVVSDIPGNREWVQPGLHGWWFPDGDVQALSAVILGAAGDRQRLVEMGRAARRQAEQRADWKKNFPRLLDAYRLAWSFQGAPKLSNWEPLD
jgi:glycosyltransferase involved in cell wall biosynthesis